MTVVPTSKITFTGWGFGSIYPSPTPPQRPVLTNNVPARFSVHSHWDVIQQFMDENGIEWTDIGRQLSGGGGIGGGPLIETVIIAVPDDKHACLLKLRFGSEVR